MSDVRLPAEWESHYSTWIAWPHCRSDWPGKFASIPWVYVELVRHLSTSETVDLICCGQASEDEARSYLDRSDVDTTAVRFHAIETDRSWLRDSAPTGVIKRQGMEWIGWNFNGWGRYENFSRDRRVAEELAQRSRRPISLAKREDCDAPFHLEGGAFDGNGADTLMVTEQCLLSNTQVRNPGLTREGYEDLFRRYLGVRSTIWLQDGCTGDDTHGHVDDIARFVASDCVVAVQPDSSTHPDWRSSQQNLEILGSAKNADGARLSIVEIPMPEPMVFDGELLPASYANFYIANTVVLVPTFKCSADKTALGILAELFPGRRVVGIDATDFILGLGTFHCSTQQQPNDSLTLTELSSDLSR